MTGERGRAQINLRVLEAVVEDLDVLAANENVSRVDVARQILLEGIAARKRALALRLYREGRVTKSRAAELARISLWEMHDLLDESGAAEAYTVRDAVEEVRRIVAEGRGSY